MKSTFTLVILVVGLGMIVAVQWRSLRRMAAVQDEAAQRIRSLEDRVTYLDGRVEYQNWLTSAASLKLSKQK